MVLKIIATMILSVISAITYRMGGSGNYPRWVRQVGVCSAMTIEMIILGHLHWTLLLCFGALFGLSSTYFKKKGTDAMWWNWALVGLSFSLSMLPLVIAQGLWVGFFSRTIACIILTTGWSQLIGNAVWEECGRGAIIILTLPLLLIGA